MHAIKDYWDMVRILDDYPQIKQAFNFSPSLLEQIQDYALHDAKDEAYILSEKDPLKFTDDERVRALKIFFLANTERMIRRYPRYAELHDKLIASSTGSMRDTPQANFNEQDFRDLQVWWNLAWIGEYSRFDPPFKMFLDKQRNFTEEEKYLLLRSQVDIIRKIIPHHVAASKRGQVEMAVSPYFHPILPLLSDTDVALKANKRASLPHIRFKQPEDASRQIETAIAYAKQLFGRIPRGMWPSEGSVSDAALRIIAENNVRWVGTDETILRNTLAVGSPGLDDKFLERYFAYNYLSGKQKLKIFFRDHGLSDLIGFSYSRRGPDEAAQDFVNRLLSIRGSLANAYGDKVFQFAVVPIIMDGENAWEFYQSDGKDFLRTLYYLMSNDSRLKTVLPSEVKVMNANFLKHVEPGSWIDGNFNIWIGDTEENQAWEMLYQTRVAFDKYVAGKDRNARDEAYRELMIAEGSDWFWWYGSKHQSPEKQEFDQLFRYHIRRVYSFLGVPVPAAAEQPISRSFSEPTSKQPTRRITPRFDAPEGEAQWEGAGFVEHGITHGAMQKTGVALKRISYGNDEKNIYLKIDTTNEVSAESVIIELVSPDSVTIEIGDKICLRREGRVTGKLPSIRYLVGDTIWLAIGIYNLKSDEAAFTVSVRDGKEVLDCVPEQGTIGFKLI